MDQKIEEDIQLKNRLQKKTDNRKYNRIIEKGWKYNKNNINRIKWNQWIAMENWIENRI